MVVGNYKSPKSDSDSDGESKNQTCGPLFTSIWSR